MEYEVFKQHIKECVQAQIRKGGKVFVNHVIKNNGKELDGLVIMEEGSNVAPTIYLNAYYAQYQEGKSVEDIVTEVINLHELNKNNLNFASDLFDDYANIKEKIVYKVINYEKNEKLLEDIPHKRILDLAVVYYCLLEQDKGISATALVHNSHLKGWNITEEQLYNDAVYNTPKLLKSCIKPMSVLLREMMENGGECEEEIEETRVPAQEGEMYVLTNQSRVNGAACILYEKVLEQFANMVASDLYILPSSVHEVIILPKHGAYNKKMLEEMVREVNEEGVSADEVLSDNVYEYCRSEKTIIL